jgi:DNA-binding GntR family transcriptional regulator
MLPGDPGVQHEQDPLQRQPAPRGSGLMTGRVRRGGGRPPALSSPVLPPAKTTPSDQRDAAEAQTLADQLRDAIVAGRIPEGTPLRQGDLGRQYGVSRTPAREALHSLDAWGLVDLVANKSAVVRRIPRRDYEGAYLVRAELEALAVELATPRINEEGLARLECAVEVFERIAQDVLECRAIVGGTKAIGESWIDANEVFHRTILDFAGSPRLLESLEAASGLISRGRSWEALRGSRFLVREAGAFHREIFELMKSGSPRRAAKRMRQHVLRAGEVFLEWRDLNATDDVARTPHGDDNG